MTSDGRTVKVRPARITCRPPARCVRRHPGPGRRGLRDDESPVAYESKEGRSIVAARASTAVEDDGQRWLSLAYRPWMRLVTSLLKRAAPRESFIDAYVVEAQLLLEGGSRRPQDALADARDEWRGHESVACWLGGDCRDRGSLRAGSRFLMRRAQSTSDSRTNSCARPLRPDGLRRSRATNRAAADDTLSGGAAERDVGMPVDVFPVVPAAS
jgi:hypothetical protein